MGEEKRHNPRLTLPAADFEELMAGLNLPYPKQIDRALPLNLRCGAQEAEDDAAIGPMAEATGFGN